MPASSAGDMFMLGQVAIILRVWMRPAQPSPAQFGWKFQRQNSGREQITSVSEVKWSPGCRDRDIETMPGPKLGQIRQYLAAPAPGGGIWLPPATNKYREEMNRAALGEEKSLHLVRTSDASVRWSDFTTFWLLLIWLHVTNWPQGPGDEISHSRHPGETQVITSHVTMLQCSASITEQTYWFSRLISRFSNGSK